MTRRRWEARRRGRRRSWAPEVTHPPDEAGTGSSQTRHRRGTAWCCPAPGSTAPFSSMAAARRRTPIIACQVDRPQAEEPDNRCVPGADMRVARLAAQLWGVLSVDELRECGLSDDAVGVRVGN